MILAIYGTGGLGREVCDFVTKYSELRIKWQKIIYLDDTKNEGWYDEHEVYPLDRALEKFNKEELEICIAVGEPRVKKILLDKVRSNGLHLTTIIHPLANIASSAIIGEGVLIKQGAIVSCNAIIGENTCLQEYCAVGHDSEVGKNCQLSCFTFVGGGSKIGYGTYISPHVSIKDRVMVGSNTIIGMGSVVLRDIGDNLIAMGNPARGMKKNEEQRVFK